MIDLHLPVQPPQTAPTQFEVLAPYAAIAAPALSAVAALFSAYVAVRAYRISRDASQQHLFELARSLHEDLTTGAVQEARGTLGFVVHSGARLDRTTLPDCMDAYFRLLWSFERVWAGREVIRKAGARGADKQPSPLGFLDDLVGWHVTEWARNIGQRREAVAREGVTARELRPRLHAAARAGLDDADAFQAFEKLVISVLGTWPASIEAAEGATGGQPGDSALCDLPQRGEP
ncbi:hypothetical protein AD006_32495 (plasmid) [Pseudonocardia sp. EC080610-09]|uniref:hypothetical protein n=1 Tax=Pseudonocardia sp. EC080610-09 TaxID=1688404 RepID=UPI00070627FB|nr:hypothetical protein [Pseudonocardia sp. EC080610-09]ALL79945.1 hypothetical protein AD006_32495 [Pseudonocardia sp. EC080610-09]